MTSTQGAVEGVRVGVITRGHPFAAEPFFAMIDAVGDLVAGGVEWTHVEHPQALELVEPGRADDFDVFVMYDMPGITFTGGEPPVVFDEPPAAYRQAYVDLLERGKGMVFLHHAIAGWPAWPEYAEIIGGRFHYQPAELGAVSYPDSGYRHDVTHEVEVVATDHPVCAGLPLAFEITDEVYLFPVFEDSVVPLLRSRHRFTADGFYSADLAIRGQRNANSGWSHPDGSDLVAWTNSRPNSPVVYIQFGDGPQTYADPNYRQVVANAITWAAQTQT